MPRTTLARTATIGTTSGSAAITGGAGTFDKSDVGRKITGTGIPAGATIAAVTSATAATLSANATATGSPSATIAAEPSVSSVTGFHGWSPESGDEAASYTVAANNAGTVPPDKVTGPNVPAPSLTRRQP